MPWVNLIDVASLAYEPDPGHSIVAGVSSFTADADYSSPADACTPPSPYTSQQYLQAAVGAAPAGYAYTGRVRLNVIANTFSSPYDHLLFLASSAGSPIATGTVTYDPEDAPCLNAEGGTLVCIVGVNDGGGGSGSVEFSLELETIEVASVFWTDFSNCYEET